MDFLFKGWGFAGFVLTAAGATGLYLALGEPGSAAVGPLAVGLGALAWRAARRPLEG